MKRLAIDDEFREFTMEDDSFNVKSLDTHGLTGLIKAIEKSHMDELVSQKKGYFFTPSKHPAKKTRKSGRHIEWKWIS